MAGFDIIKKVCIQSFKDSFRRNHILGVRFATIKVLTSSSHLTKNFKDFVDCSTGLFLRIPWMRPTIGYITVMDVACEISAGETTIITQLELWENTKF